MANLLLCKSALFYIYSGEIRGQLVKGTTNTNTGRVTKYILAK
jgi:hypothetical protein